MHDHWRSNTRNQLHTGRRDRLRPHGTSYVQVCGQRAGRDRPWQARPVALRPTFGGTTNATGTRTDESKDERRRLSAACLLPATGRVRLPHTGDHARCFRCFRTIPNGGPHRAARLRSDRDRRRHHAGHALHPAQRVGRHRLRHGLRRDAAEPDAAGPLGERGGLRARLRRRLGLRG